MSDLPPSPVWPAPDNDAANAGLPWAATGNWFRVKAFSGGILHPETPAPEDRFPRGTCLRAIPPGSSAPREGRAHLGARHNEDRGSLRLNSNEPWNFRIPALACGDTLVREEDLPSEQPEEPSPFYPLVPSAPPSREEARGELALDVAAMRRLGVLAWKRPDVGEIVLGAPPPTATAPREAPRKETPDEERLRLHLERSRVTFAASGMRPKEPPP